MVRARGQRRSRGVVGQKRSALGREKHRDRGLSSARVNASPRGIARGFSRGFAHRASPGVPRGVAEVNDAGGGRGAGGISSREGSGMGARRRRHWHAPPTNFHVRQAVRPAEGEDPARDGGQRGAGFDSLPQEEVVAHRPVLHRDRRDLGRHLLNARGEVNW